MERKQERSAFGEMAEGLRFAVSNPRTRVLLAIGLLPFFLLIPVFGTLYPIYAKDEFAAGPTGLGLLLTAVGVGGTLGGFIANALGRAERQGLLQAVWVVVMAASIIGVALSPARRRDRVQRRWRRGRDGARLEQHGDAPDRRAGGDARPHLGAAHAQSGVHLLGALVAGPLSDAVGVRNASMHSRGHGDRRRRSLREFTSLRELRHK